MILSIARLGPATILSVNLILSSCSAGRKAAPDLPLGGVNAPVSGQKVAGKVDAVGWALAESGIDSVSIYVDRRFVARAATGLPRPDVAQAYPSISGNGNAGWTLPIDAARFSPGWHELTIQARSKEGATHDLASIPILIER